MLKANDLRERTLEDLRDLEKTLAHDIFENRFKNFTNRLDDTSSIKKAKKDLARVKTILTERRRRDQGLTPVAHAAKPAKPATEVASEPPTTEEAPKSKAKKAAATVKASAKSAEKPAAPAKTKKTAATKKSEA